MVEDDPKDVELILTALEEYNLANEVVVTRDGQEALDYLYCRGEFSTRSSETPRSCCSIEAAEGRWIGSLAANQVRRTPEDDPGGGVASSHEEKDMMRSYHSG